jgi:DNA-binding TFAR19-related protein (PDSD5 family)
MGGYTTVLLHKETKERLETMKEYAKESYDEVINKLITIVKVMKDEGKLSEDTLKDIREAREQVKKGKTMSTKELMVKLGL